MKIIKMLSMLVLLMISMGIMAVSVAATVYDLDVKVNGDTIEQGDILSVERGEILYVKASVGADDDMEDVKLRAWIGGYDDEIEDESEMFDLVYNEDTQQMVKRTETLQMELPADMDSDEEYTLNVELLGKKGSLTKQSVELRIDRTRHNLNIMDIDVEPSMSLVAGETVEARARVKNVGDKKEEDIKVLAEIPELGVFERVYIEELCSYEEDDEDCESSDWSPWLSFELPEDAEGEYDLYITVLYDNERYEETEIVELSVEGVEGEEETAEGKPVEIDSSIKGNGDSLISTDATTQTVERGEEIVYKIKVANIDDASKVYSIKIAGTKLWADTRAEPSFVSVEPGKTSDVYVYLKAQEDAELGSWPFTVQVLENSRLVKELEFTAKVYEGDGDRIGVGFTKFLSENALKVAFVVLIVAILAIGLVVAVRKLKNGDEEDEFDLEEGEGKGYY